MITAVPAVRLHTCFFQCITPYPEQVYKRSADILPSLLVK